MSSRSGVAIVRELLYTCYLLTYMETSQKWYKPSTRLYEGDLSLLLNMFAKMSDKLDETRSALTAIVREVQGVKQQVQVLSTSVARSRSRPKDAVLSSQSGGQPVCAVLPNDETEINPRNSRQQSVESVRQQRQSADGGQSISTWNWAAASTITSTPTLHNRFAALQSTDDDGDEPPYIEHHSRHSMKRRRQQSEQQQQQQRHQPEQQEQQPEQQTRGNTQKRGRVLMTGKHAGNGECIKVAKKIIKKAVFCVDNVQTSYIADDLSRFFSSLNFKVISCFKVNPRRRRNETDPITDRSAFRLCIDASDRDRLLDESKWPEHVVISDWYFVDPVARQQRPAGAGERPRDDPAVTPAGHNGDDANNVTVLYHGNDNMDTVSNDNYGC